MDTKLNRNLEDIQYKTRGAKFTINDMYTKQEGEDKVNGYAIKALVTTFNDPDVVGDIIIERAFDEWLLTSPVISMYMAHDGAKIVGQWTKFTKTAIGIEADGYLVSGNTDSSNAKSLIVNGIIDSVSVGIRAQEYTIIEDGSGVRFEKAILTEVSLVDRPANANAVLLAVKEEEKAKATAEASTKDIEKSLLSVHLKLISI